MSNPGTVTLLSGAFTLEPIVNIVDTENHNVQRYMLKLLMQEHSILFADLLCKNTFRLIVQLKLILNVL